MLREQSQRQYFTARSQQRSPMIRTARSPMIRTSRSLIPGQDLENVFGGLRGHTRKKQSMCSFSKSYPKIIFGCVRGPQGRTRKKERTKPDPGTTLGECVRGPQGRTRKNRECVRSPSLIPGLILECVRGPRGRTRNNRERSLIP